MYEKALKLIKKYEGFRPDPYQCAGGVWTVGYGSTILYNSDGSIMEKVHKNSESITIVELAEWQIQTHLEVAVAPIIHKNVKAPLNDNQFQALLSFVYNIGGGSFCKSNTLKVLNAQDYELFEKEFKEWRMAKGKVLQGLVNRRHDELKLFNEVG